MSAVPLLSDAFPSALPLRLPATAAASGGGAGSGAVPDAKAQTVGGYVYAVHVPIQVAIVGPPSLCARLDRSGALANTLKPALIKVGIAGTHAKDYSRLAARFKELARDVHRDINLHIDKGASDTTDLRMLIAHHIAGVPCGDDDKDTDVYKNLITVTDWLSGDIESSESAVMNAFGVPLPKLKAIELSERKVQYSGCTELLLTTQSLCDSQRTVFESGEDATYDSLRLSDLYDSVPVAVWLERDVEFEFVKRNIYGVTERVRYTAPLFKFYFDSRADMETFLDADDDNTDDTDTSCKSAVASGTTCQCDAYMAAPLKGMVCGNCDHHKFWHDHDVTAPSPSKPAAADDDKRPGLTPNPTHVSAEDAKAKESAAAGDAKGKELAVAAAAAAAVTVGDVKVVAAAPVIDGPAAGASAAGRHYTLTIKDVLNGNQYTRAPGPLPQFIKEHGVQYTLASVVERAGVQYVVVNKGSIVTAEYQLHQFFGLQAPNTCQYKLD